MIMKENIVLYMLLVRSVFLNEIVSEIIFINRYNVRISNLMYVVWSLCCLRNFFLKIMRIIVEVKLKIFVFIFCWLMFFNFV